MSSIVSHKHKFIYTHIPRTAGTSFTDYVRQFCESKVLELPHYPLSELENRVNGNWVDYYKFSIVRNPFERAVSLFHRVPSAWNNDFSVFLNASYTWRRRETYCPAETYLCGNGEEKFDHVLRFENIVEDLIALFDRLDIELDFRKYPHWSRTNHKQYRDCYTPELRQIVEQRSAWEIERFGYHY